MKPLIIGNWKMNHGPKATKEYCESFRNLVEGLHGVEVGVAPPFVSLPAAAEALRGSNVALAAQDVFFEVSGAYTGEVPASMLKECGCTYVIVAHSERRTLFGETDGSARQKLRAVLREGMNAVLCIGETLQERETHRTIEVVTRQIDKALEGMAKEPELPFGNGKGRLVLAYEPVWAIGSGRAATEKDIAEVHTHIRKRLQSLFGGEQGGAIPIQYGGSVRPENIGGIVSIPDVNGCLVGGASLDPKTFAELCKRAAPK